MIFCFHYYLLISCPCLWFIAVYQQLQEYEQKLFGSSDSSNPALPTFSPAVAPSFNFGFSKPNDPVPVSVPAFNNLGATSILTHPPLEVPLHEFTFGAGNTQKNISESLANPSGNDIQMDSTWIPEVSFARSPASPGIEWDRVLWGFIWNLAVNCE